MTASVKKGLLLVGILTLGSSVAFGAELTLPSLDSAMAKVTEWFGVILVGLAIMWGYRKITSTTNKT